MSVSDISFRIPLGLLLIVIALAGYFVNVLAFVVYVCRRKLRTPPFYFIVHLLVVDLLAVVCWTSLSAAAAVAGNWPLPFVVCQIQGYIMSFCNLINMHTMTVLAIERCLLMAKPSLHEDCFAGVYTGFFIAALWVTDAVIAVFSAVHWAEMLYSPYQYQCYSDHDRSVSHLNFFFTMTYALPMFFMFVLYVISFCYVYDIRTRKVSPSGALVLEVNQFAIGDSYSDRLARQEEKFKNAGMRPDKPNLGKTMTFTPRGYITNDTETEDGPEPLQKVKKREYFLAKHDYDLMKAYVVMTCVYVACWFPYVMLSYAWTYKPRSYSTLPWEVTTVFTLITHCGSFVKPLILVLMVESFKVALLRTVARDETKKHIKETPVTQWKR
ncbi:rhodopsin-like [Gigantopelta aegis]|uniref:rhodopsin-like n=1 Tax=Gigantopelta aegis TaxID=1735272 RepID=UPI001B88CC95|nr:rhodopsin-like [Gigantopelta aegis]